MMNLLGWIIKKFTRWRCLWEAGIINYARTLLVLSVVHVLQACFQFVISLSITISLQTSNPKAPRFEIKQDCGADVCWLCAHWWLSVSVSLSNISQEDNGSLQDRRMKESTILAELQLHFSSCDLAISLLKFLFCSLLWNLALKLNLELFFFLLFAVMGKNE